MDLLTFHLGDREFGVDLGRVLEILNPPPITRVPEMPPALLGLIGLRGDPTGVVDAGLRLDGWPVEVSGRTPVIILRAVIEGTSVPFGLLVEAAGRRVSVERLLPWSDHQADLLGKDACIGFAALDGRLVLVLDVDRLLVFPPLPATQRSARPLTASAPVPTVLTVPTNPAAEAGPRGRKTEAHASASAASITVAGSSPTAPASSARSTSQRAPSRGVSLEGDRHAAAPVATVPSPDRPDRSEQPFPLPGPANAPAPEPASHTSAAHVRAPSPPLPTSGSFRGARSAPSSSADRTLFARRPSAAPIEPRPPPVAPPAPIPRQPNDIAGEWIQRPLPSAMTQAAAFTPPPEADLSSPPPSTGRIPGLAWVGLVALLLLALGFAVTRMTGGNTSSRRLAAPQGIHVTPPPAFQPPSAIPPVAPLPLPDRRATAEPVAPVEPPTDRRPMAPEPQAAATPPAPAAAPPVAAAPEPPFSPPRKARPVPEAMRVTSDTPACEIHEVRKGDTLWWISAHRLGNPFRWPELFGENRGQIVDPDVIEIHDRIRIPGGCAPSPAR
jgi:purine-binding chemotaxis protein CheW